MSQPTSPRRERNLPPLLSISPAAAARLRELYAGENKGQLLRLSLKTKGCSGLAYDLTWVEAAGPGDERVEDGEVSVLVDRKASLFLVGTLMDYRVTPFRAGFSFITPGSESCGCGESFHLAG